MKPRLAALLGVAALLVLLFPGPATASTGSGVVFASYWEEFVDYWRGVVQKQNGVVMGVLGLGVVALFIITRGKWRK